MKKKKKLMTRTVLFLLISLFSSYLMVLFVAFGYEENQTLKVIAPIVVSAFFWLFLVLGYVSFYQVSALRKKQEKKKGFVPDKKRKAGIVVFFSNRYAKIADILMLLLFVGMIVFYILFISGIQGSFVEIAAMLFITTFLFSVQMHCILNGINFQYILQTEEKPRPRRGRTRRSDADVGTADDGENQSEKGE